MSTNKGISVNGWAIYLILLLIVINYVAEQYSETHQLEWIPLAFMAGFGVIGGYSSSLLAVKMMRVVAVALIYNRHQIAVV